jgi:hypothetical protein
MFRDKNHYLKLYLHQCKINILFHIAQNRLSRSDNTFGIYQLIDTGKCLGCISIGIYHQMQIILHGK